MIEVSGTCRPEVEPVHAAFVDNFETRDDIGASVAIVVDGELVVDLWGGHLDRGKRRPWRADTIINVFSTTKTMTSLCGLVLASRGQLDLDAPVCEYWPEFAAAGKERILVRHVLSHTAGLPSWEQRLTAEDLYDWDRVTSLLASQTPKWEPGAKSGYHTFTFGNLVGEIVRRIDGRPIGDFFAQEIARPIGADFHFRVHPDDDDRVALVIPPESEEDDAPMADPALASFRAEDSWELPFRRAEIPAVNGHGNARSVAAVQAVISNSGSMSGVELLEPSIVDRIFEVQAAGRDAVLGVGVTLGIGFGLNSSRRPISPSERVCYWGGWGGSIVVNDVDRHMTLAYVMNRMGSGTTGDMRAHSLLQAAYACL